MNVASLDLCKELYELSGWRNGALRWYLNNYQESGDPYKYGGSTLDKVCPLYDLGFLLRKLPHYNSEGWDITIKADGEEWFSAFYQGPRIEHIASLSGADTPEDAACKLAIDLFKQGILKKETN